MESALTQNHAVVLLLLPDRFTLFPLYETKLRHPDQPLTGHIKMHPLACLRGIGCRMVHVCMTGQRVLAVQELNQWKPSMFVGMSLNRLNCVACSTTGPDRRLCLPIWYPSNTGMEPPSPHAVRRVWEEGGGWCRAHVWRERKGLSRTGWK